MPLIQSRVDAQIATIGIDHPAKRNALGATLIAEILAAFETFKAQQIRVVILRAATAGSIWSAGHDVNELPKGGAEPLSYSDPLEQLIRGVKHFPAPVIAMVQGSVWGGACELVMACDMVIADETCGFAITPARLGLPYNAAGLQSFLNRLPLNIVKEMFFTAEPIPATRAELAGIVNAIIPAAELEAHTYGIARTIASRSPQSVAAIKAGIRVLSDATAISPAAYEYLEELRRAVYCGPEYQEGISAFLAKRPAVF
jgi:methylmalonyl-CoA decarboxylase